MSVESSRPKKDADAIEAKYGAYAEVYAETRREAAGRAGDEADEDHWSEVAAALDEDDDQ